MTNPATPGTSISVEDHIRFVGLEPEEVMRRALVDVHGEGGDGRLGADGQWMARCPAPDHNDSNASFHWFSTASRQVKFTCFGGCEYGDVMKGLRLKAYQLKPMRTQYDYYNRDGVYRFTVERTNKADGTKDYKQFYRNDDGSKADKPSDDVDVLWLEPELQEWAEDRRAAGKGGTLILPEGEKDVHAIYATGAAHGPGGEGDGPAFVTTSPQGAKNWKIEHTARVAELMRGGGVWDVDIVCDPDSAGYQRGYRIREELLAELGGEFTERIRVWAPPVGDDLADECDRLKLRWRSCLQPVDEGSLALLIEEGSAASGSVRRMPLGRGARDGRMGMASVLGEDKIALVIAGEIRPVKQWDGGWVVQILDPHDVEPREVILERRDMVSKSAFDRWLVSEAHLSPLPRNGIGTGEFALQLQAYLKWYCRTMKVERVVVTQYLTWVDRETGEPAKLVETRDVEAGSGEEVSHNESVAFVTGIEDVDRAAGVRWIGDDRAGSGWGKKGTELDAAWAWARALTFGDEATVAVVAGWVGAMVASPWLGRWMPTKPGLAVIAPSGSGKTHGAPRLLLQLAGCNGNMTASVAGLRRRLAVGGVANIQWVDDSGMLDDHAFKEVLRVATSQGDHVLANTDAGTRATDGAKLTGCVVVSAEGVSWMDEVAMADRFVRVKPGNPQSRKSWMRGREGELQWADVQELIGEGDLGGGTGLTVYAGWTVEGIRRVVEGREGRMRIARWVDAIGKPKGRNDVGPFVAALGLRAVLTWLHGVKAAAGDAWPGNTHAEATNEGAGPGSRMSEWQWLIDAMANRLAEAREANEALPTIASVVMPALLRQAGRKVTGKGTESAALWATVPGTDEATLKRDLHAWCQIGSTGGVGGSGQIEAPLPIAFRDGEDRVWVAVEQLADWYAREGARAAGKGIAEERIAGHGALRDQMDALADDPDWAVWMLHKGKGRSYERKGFRVGRRGTSRPTYRRFSVEAGEAMLP